MVRYNVYLEKEQVEALRQFTTVGTSLAEHVRRAIAAYVIKMQKQSSSVSPSTKEPHE